VFTVKQKPNIIYYLNEAEASRIYVSSRLMFQQLRKNFYCFLKATVDHWVIFASLQKTTAVEYAIRY
jgi:hypothetical protein